MIAGGALVDDVVSIRKRGRTGVEAEKGGGANFAMEKNDVRTEIWEQIAS